MVRFQQRLFGPAREGNSTRFRLWAPERSDIALEIEGRSSVPMRPRNDGWCEAVAECEPGTRYVFRVNGQRVADPASRLQSGGVHGWSVVVDSSSYGWRSISWRGRPWQEVVIYETHAGLEGGYARLSDRLPSLKELGITAVELMPVAAFPGNRNWGYDGVLPFAPSEAYGTPDELRALVDRAHELGLMIFLDVVYNHFGPDGNYIALYAPRFFRDDLHTPWGTAMDFRRPQVRRFFIENALYWIEDFRIDGLRLDAVHCIRDRGWLHEMAAEIRASVPGDRHVHLTTENDDNDAQLLRDGFDAQWNDDFHHVAHVLLTAESDGYYADHADAPAERLARVLRGGFDYQGQHSRYRGRDRGTSSTDLPPTAFVSFLQNHDQTGNRLLGERLTLLADRRALEAATALLLLAPQIPLLFVGEETGSRAPFLYFTDHEPILANAIRDGRAREFSLTAGSMPDPNDIATFHASRPDADAPQSGGWRSLYRDLLRIRFERIVPQLANARALDARAIGSAAVIARWQLAHDVLTIAVNLGRETVEHSLPRRCQIWGAEAAESIAPFTTLAWLGS
ncbi:MAG TPA: malto-oligosyltrehalose trehalohydrolase [Rhizomicrobium sp.]